jgi:hypothetical protein
LQNINSSLLASHRNNSNSNLSTSSWGGSYDLGDSPHVVYKVYNDDNNSVISSNAPDIDDNLDNIDDDNDDDYQENKKYINPVQISETPVSGPNFSEKISEKFSNENENYNYNKIPIKSIYSDNDDNTQKAPISLFSSLTNMAVNVVNISSLSRGNLTEIDKKNNINNLIQKKNIDIEKKGGETLHGGLNILSPMKIIGSSSGSPQLNHGI